MKTIAELNRLRRPVAQMEFANDGGAGAEAVCFANELTIAEDGWAQLAPFGDFPGDAFRKEADGTVTKFPAVQRLDAAAAKSMVEHFNSATGRIKRFFRGCPIYAGHPDTPKATWKYNYSDGAAKGMIVDLAVRDSGLFCKPVFSNDAEEILNGGQKLFLSGRWTSDELPSENGKRVFRPDQLKSAGLTPRPNLPVEQVNDRPPENQPSTQTDPMKQSIIVFLASHGIQFANDAEDAKVLEALANLGLKAKSADTLATEKTQWANDRAALEGKITAKDGIITGLTSERDTHKTNFANERADRVKGLLDAAITGGRITAAQRPDWERRLNNQAEFANELAALGHTGAVLKTISITGKSGERKVEIANAAQRTDTVAMLVQTEMDESKCDYDTAFARVRKQNPALFEAMKQPKAA